jgi:hypothetical protein
MIKEVIGSLVEIFNQLGLSLRKRIYLGQKFKIDNVSYKVTGFDRNSESDDYIVYLEPLEENIRGE